ncbi:MAG: DUF2330 domain-containing protein, partial [Polyangiaceae bacterium]
MIRSRLALGVVTALTAATFAGERRAAACGGCFTPPSQSVSDITDERMLLSVSPVQSTLYDQIQYSGSPSNFAWVLPIHGTVSVGLSADVLFDSVDTLTKTQIYPPQLTCPSPTCFGGSSSGASSGGGFGLAAGANAPVQVLVSQNVGPYATVQLHSTDGSALNDWLAANGYNIPAASQPILSAYVAEGFDFLAMKLLPNQGVKSMRPVRVTTPGASLSLPLRMASIGTGAITGITIWVVGDGRYEPQNFPFFHIEDSQLVWDFGTSSSNYTTVRTQQEAKLKNAGWEIESSIDVNEQTITSVIESGGQYYANGGFGGGVASDPAMDYLPIGTPPDGGAEGGTDAGAGDDGGGYESAQQVRDEDITALFVGMTGPSVRLTRVRSDIAQSAMSQDIVFQAASDQSELSNVHNLTQSVNFTCPIYNGCEVVGQGTPAQASASIAEGAASGSGATDVVAGDDGGTGFGAAPPTVAETRGGGGCTASSPPPP